MRVIGYARVSTIEQAETGVSLDAQRERMKLYCDLYGHELLDVIADAASAKSLKRDGIQEVFRMLRSGEAEGVVVMKLDRLTRSLKDLQNLLEEFFAAGALTPRQLMSVNEQLDTSTANGRMMTNLLMVIAQWEREVIGERTREALDYKKSKGERVGGIPYGWKLAEDGIALVTDIAEQRAMQLAHEFRGQGCSLRLIGDKLWSLGYAQRNGSRWQPQSVKNLLNRELAR
jgi:DNA invertase Pin-like site-specific DNA recombinase